MKSLGETFRVAATLAAQAPCTTGLRCVFLGCENKSVSYTRQSRTFSWGERTKQRKKYLPLNWQKPGLLNVGEMKENHHGNPPLALTMAPLQGPIVVWST